MTGEKLIPEKIESFEYYKNKIPLYLQNSYGFVEHFKIWHELLIGSTSRSGVVGNGEILLNLLTIFDPGYITFINNLDGSESGTKCDILDKIGALFGVSRNFTITYVDHAVTYTEDLQLNNQDFLILVRSKIIKNNCDGTREIMINFYKDAQIPIFVNSSDSPAVADMYLIESGIEEYQYSENIKKMYLAGMLNIESVGITYRTHDPIDLQNMLIWDGDRTWANSDLILDTGEGEWSI